MFFALSELRAAKLKIKELKAEKLKLLGQVAKKKKKGGKTKKKGLNVPHARDDTHNVNILSLVRTMQRPRSI